MTKEPTTQQGSTQSPSQQQQGSSAPFQQQGTPKPIIHDWASI